MSILVTGATGFIGSHLVRCLVERGESVRVLCRRTADVSILDGLNIEVCWGDVLDASSVEAAMKGCDRVYHLAAYARTWAKDPQTFFAVNVGGLRNVLTSAVKTSVAKVVFTSSSITLSPSNQVPSDESTPQPRKFLTAYQHSKFMAEQEAQRFLEAGLHVVTVFPTRVFGPGLLNEGNSATRMIKWYLEGKWRLGVGSGKGIGNYGFVCDLVRGLVLAMEKGGRGERYLVGGENLSYNDFFEILSEISGRRYKLFHVSPSVVTLVSLVEELRGKAFGHHPLITRGWVQTFLLDWGFSLDKARRELGYTFTPFREALGVTVRWLVEQNARKEDCDEISDRYYRRENVVPVR